MNGEKDLYRLYSKRNRKSGDWLIEKDLLEEAEYKSELIDQMALLPEEWNTEYSAVSKLDTSEVELNSKLRVSTAGGLKSDVTGEVRSGGAEQYRVIRPEGEYISNDAWSFDGDLEKYVEERGS